MNRIRNIMVLLFAILLLGSCVSERDMAKSFVEKFSMKNYVPTEKIYVCLPKTVVHTNQTLNQMESFLDLEYASQDSVIVANTEILNLIDDKIFLQQFSSNLLYNLQRLGIPVEIVEDPLNMPKAVENKIFTLQILQIEAEEFIKNTISSDFQFSYSYDLKGFSTNVWYLLNDTSSTENKDVYYKSFEVLDQLNLTDCWKKDSTYYAKGIHSKINVNDAYNMAYKAGAMSAKIFCEKIINDYIASKVRFPKYYYVYDPVNNEVYDIYSNNTRKNMFEKVE